MFVLHNKCSATSVAYLNPAKLSLPAIILVWVFFKSEHNECWEIPNSEDVVLLGAFAEQQSFLSV